MINKVAGYRNMLGFSQKKMAAALNISEGQYRAKEKGRYDFSQSEMRKFHSLIKIKLHDVTIETIFF